MLSSATALFDPRETARVGSWTFLFARPELLWDAAE